MQPNDSKKYHTRNDYFRLLFEQLEPNKTEPFDIMQPSCQGWQNKLYIQGVQQIRKDLARSEEKLEREFMWHLRQSFDTHCLCIPAAVRDRWLAGTEKRLRPGFIGFDKTGDRGVYTWEVTERILSMDCCWSWSAAEVTDQQVIEALVHDIDGKGVQMNVGETNCWTSQGVKTWKWRK